MQINRNVYQLVSVRRRLLEAYQAAVKLSNDYHAKLGVSLTHIKSLLDAQDEHLAALNNGALENAKPGSRGGSRARKSPEAKAQATESRAAEKAKAAESRAAEKAKADAIKEKAKAKAAAEKAKADVAKAKIKAAAEKAKAKAAAEKAKAKAAAEKAKGKPVKAKAAAVAPEKVAKAKPVAAPAPVESKSKPKASKPKATKPKATKPAAPEPTPVSAPKAPKKSRKATDVGASAAGDGNTGGFTSGAANSEGLPSKAEKAAPPVDPLA